MESIITTIHHSNPFTTTISTHHHHHHHYHRIPSLPKPSSLTIKSLSTTTPKPLSSTTLPKTLTTFLKTTTITLITTTLFLTKPSTAITPTTPLPQTTPQSSTDTEEAEKERIFEDYLQSHPDDIRALKALMEVKIKTRKFPQAIEIIEKLTQIEPQEQEWPLLKSHVYSYMGDTETAKKGFEEILEQNPLAVEAYHGLIMAASQEETEDELENVAKRIEGVMEKCKKRKEDLRDFKLLIAQVRVVEGKYSDALKVYQELVKDEPRDFRPYLCQGIIYTLLKKQDEADKQFQKYRRLVPKGHPYARYFEDNMLATKIFSQLGEKQKMGFRS